MCRFSSGESPFTWEVSLPDRSRVRIGASHPKGSVSYKRNGAGWEHKAIPAEVCRILKRRVRDDELTVLSEQELEQAIESATNQGARNILLRLIARRDYSRKEACDKLITYGFDYSTAKRAVDDLADIHAIDDLRYADVFIRSKIASGWGMARIERELGNKGVDIHEVEGWPYDYLDPEDEVQRALEVAARKRVSGPQAWQKLVRFIAGRGFGLDVAKRAASLALESRREEMERAY